VVDDVEVASFPDLGVIVATNPAAALAAL